MEEIIRLMVGRELNNQFPPKTNKPGEVALEVENLTAQYSLLKEIMPQPLSLNMFMILNRCSTSSSVREEVGSSNTITLE